MSIWRRRWRGFSPIGLVPLGFAAEAQVGGAGMSGAEFDVLTREDLVIAISYGDAFGAVELGAQDARPGGPTFGIADGSTTPIAMHCDGHLLAPISQPFDHRLLRRADGPDQRDHPGSCAHLQPKRALAMPRRTEADIPIGRALVLPEPLRASEWTAAEATVCCKWARHRTSEMRTLACSR